MEDISVNFEVYRNYHSIAFSDGYVYEVWNDRVTEGNLKEVYDKLHGQPMYTYNGIAYDRFMIEWVFGGYGCNKLKRLNDELVGKTMPRLPYPRITKGVEYIDLMPSMPKEMDSAYVGGASLALCAARNRSPLIVGLDLYLDQTIDTLAQANMVRDYNLLNCKHTVDLIPVCRQVLDIKQYLSTAYGTDFVSSTFQQIAERVVKSELGIDIVEYDGKDVLVKYVRPNSIINNINIPDYTYNSEVKNKGAVYPSVTIAGKVYEMGSGGLHSTEKSMVVHHDDEYEIVDFDVTSYYPSIIEQYRPPFHYDKSGRIIDILSGWKATRVQAKKEKDTLKDLSYKLLILAMFGKMGSPYSIFFSPVGFRFVTITGQLQLIDLIQAFEDVGVSVMSANTDGVVTRCHKGNLAARDNVVIEWQARTKMALESTYYSALYAQDVSNYIAIKADGGIKGKGIYADADYNPSSWKGDNLRICVDAVKNYLTKGIDIEDTIREEQDVYKFLLFKRVRGGAYLERGDVWVGKLARFYYPRQGGSTLRVAKTHSKVPMGRNVLPAMDVTAIKRSDINDIEYIHIARDWLSRIDTSQSFQIDIFN